VEKEMARKKISRTAFKVNGCTTGSGFVITRGLGKKVKKFKHAGHYGFMPLLLLV
jgi:hypothetical protein